MGPNLMFEYTTRLLAWLPSIVAGTPDEVAQVPRAPPGELVDLVVG